MSSVIKSETFLVPDIYLLTTIRLPGGGSSTVHIYTQTIHIYTQTIQRTTQLDWGECGPCPVFASYTLAFALQLRKKQGKTSVRVAEECHFARRKQKIQSRTYKTIRIHKHNNKNALTYKIKQKLIQNKYT